MPGGRGFGGRISLVPGPFLVPGPMSFRGWLWAGGWDGVGYFWFHETVFAYIILQSR